MTVQEDSSTHEALKQSSRLRVEHSMLEAKLQLSEDAHAEETKKNARLQADIVTLKNTLEESAKSAAEAQKSAAVEEAKRTEGLNHELTTARADYARMHRELSQKKGREEILSGLEGLKEEMDKVGGAIGGEVLK